jgi:hypothetical protein
VSKERVGKTASSGLGIPRIEKPDHFRGPLKHTSLKARLDLESGGGVVYSAARAKTENGNSD